MKLSKKILEQHKKEKVVLDKPYLKFESVKDIFKFLKTNYVFCLILVLVSVGVYLNGVTGEFVSDDIGTLFMNPAVSNVSLALRTGSIHTIVTAILFTTFNATPIPFHVFNVVLHIIIAILF